MLFPPHEAIEGIDRPWFVLGVNYNSVGRYGYDIGNNPILDRQTTFNQGIRDRLEHDFERLRAWGVKVVRIWAMENGEGINWVMDDQSAPIPTGLDITFSENVRWITNLASRNNLRIYWTLLNFSDFKIQSGPVQPQGITEEAQMAIDRRYRMRRGFFNLLRNQEARDSFFRNVVCPFIDVTLTTSERQGVFAIDLMNEPDMLWPTSLRNLIEAVLRNWEIPFLNLQMLNRVPDLILENSLVRVIRFLREHIDEISEELLIPQNILDVLYMRHANRLVKVLLANRFYESHVIRFLREMAIYIHNNCNQNILVSTGFAYANTIMRYRSLFQNYFDFYDYHHYNVLGFARNDPLIQDFQTLQLGKPCIIGECGLGGQFQQEELRIPLNEAFGRNITIEDLFNHQAECIENYLNNSYDNGYAGCLVWEYGRQLNRVQNPLRLSDPADWRDKYPLLWNKRDNDQRANAFCFHAPQEPNYQGRLCGRLAARTIHTFYQTQHSQRRIP